MSLSRTEEKQQLRDNRRRLLKRTLWLITTVTVAGTLGLWLWEWTGTPAYFE